MDTKFKLIENRYSKKSRRELREIYREKKKKYENMMSVLSPAVFGGDFLSDPETPMWVKIAHMDEMLECPHCREEYEMKKKMN